MDMGRHSGRKGILDLGGDTGWKGSTAVEQVEAGRRAEEASNGAQRYTGSWRERKTGRPLKKNYLGGHTGRLAGLTPRAHVREHGTGQAPCYAVKRTVSPVRFHSPVRYIPAPRIGRARVGIQPGLMVPAQRSWPPVHIFSLGYPAPTLCTVSPARLHSPWVLC